MYYGFNIFRLCRCDAARRPRVAVMQPYYAKEFYNPSAVYAAARKVHQGLEAARFPSCRYYWRKVS